MSTETNERCLVVRAAAHTCALDVARVAEVMRPLPVTPVAGSPAGVVQGLSLIRGQAVPVVGLGSLFGAAEPAEGRFVVVRTGDKNVALAVDQVLGIRDLDSGLRRSLPPLLRNANAGVVEAIATLDSELHFVLDTGHLIPDELWSSLEAREPA